MSITVRQIRDPYAQSIEEIISYKVSLDHNGDLNAEDIHVVGAPRDSFVVKCDGYCNNNWCLLPKGILPSCYLHDFVEVVHEPVMTIVGELYILCYAPRRMLTSSSEETKDALACQQRYLQKLAAERRAEQIAHLKELFSRAGSWLTSSFRTVESSEEHTPLIWDQPPALIGRSQGKLKLPEKDL
ncbi:hypothetical protein D9615_008242 [Tricholomella constricta]|uniref:Uncharacterized protein n=1 Tax=Tricholomella constricta TaxID=117010 RepID=A0A8H5H326_9AGAR|nr:hypothetical protein D9615_008242 [Tricholomella constricta]